jgi:hypothetical protein
MQEGDIFKIGRRHYFVAPLSAELVDVLIQAAGATEDDEEDNQDLGADDIGEPSLGEGDEDLENDGLDDMVLGNTKFHASGGETALGWTNEGSQQSLGVPQNDEAESSLGWNNNGMHLQLRAGYQHGMIRESDGNCDDEPDDEDTGIDDVPHDENRVEI